MKSKRDRLPYTASRGPLFRLGSRASGDLFSGSAATLGGSDGDEPFQPALRRRTLVFLLMTKWWGSSFCSVAAMRYSSSGRRPGALTVQDTSLPSALSRESSRPMRCAPTPSFAARALMRHAVGLDVMNSSRLSRKDRLVMNAPPLLVPFGHVGKLDVVADVLRARGRVDRLLHFAEDLGELEAELRELGRIGFDHGGILGPEKGAADQLDVNPRRQVRDAWIRCGLRGGSHDAALKGRRHILRLTRGGQGYFHPNFGMRRAKPEC